jgi:hypothetical protein
MMTMMKNAGSSARQRTSKKTNGLRLSVFAFALCAMLFSACHERTKGQTTKADTLARDSVTKPRVNITVNRRFDDKGNVIGFDSTYTSFYSNMEGDTVAMDSMMRGFDNYLSQRHPSLLQREFEPLFFADSLRYPDFFHHDFFMKRYELNDAYMRNMMKQMDSIKNRYFEEHSKPPKKIGKL